MSAEGCSAASPHHEAVELQPSLSSKHRHNMPSALNRVPLFARSLLRNVPVNCRASSSSAQPLIKLTNIPAPHSGTIRVLSLNRPETRNAISKALLSELIGHVNAIHHVGASSSTRALIIASEVDTSFCAGADLKERATFTQDESATHPARPILL